MDYKVVLNPDNFGRKTDAMFYLGDSYTLAEGDGWECRLSNCGEQRLYKNGERVPSDELNLLYDTDDQLNKAINSGELEVDNHSWWELEFFKVVDNHLYFVDMGLFTDSVVDTPKEGIQLFKEFMKSKGFVNDFKKALEEGEK